MTDRELAQFDLLDGVVYCEFEVGEFKFRSQWCGDFVNIWSQDHNGEWHCGHCFTDYSLRESPDGHELAALEAAECIREEMEEFER
jgi:hypothetical protein